MNEVVFYLNYSPYNPKSFRGTVTSLIVCVHCTRDDIY